MAYDIHTAWCGGPVRCGGVLVALLLRPGEAAGVGRSAAGWAAGLVAPFAGTWRWQVRADLRVGVLEGVVVVGWLAVLGPGEVFTGVELRSGVVGSAL